MSEPGFVEGRNVAVEYRYARNARGMRICLFPRNSLSLRNPAFFDHQSTERWSHPN
jgi:hypothetical protein